jgi:hypothetical protein
MSWYAASTVNNVKDDHIQFISSNKTFTQNDLNGYSFIDYILVGGGGGGGGGADGEGVSNYGGGGGASGYLKASFTYSTTANGLNYLINNTNSTRISLNNATSATVSVGIGGFPGDGCNLTSGGNCGSGFTGGTTSLTVNYSSGSPMTNQALGGQGGQGGGYTCGGNGGIGYNGGGAGGGGSCGGYGGAGDLVNGGANGGAGDGDNGGNGGGLGGGSGGSGTDEQDGDNTGGGGGGGTCVTNPSTGGQGAESFRESDNRGTTNGANYTGAGGGGGTKNVVASDYELAAFGGTGYAIVWLHN